VGRRFRGHNGWRVGRSKGRGYTSRAWDRERRASRTIKPPPFVEKAGESHVRGVIVARDNHHIIGARRQVRWDGIGERKIRITS
jgi:hypothetical protein